MSTDTDKPKKAARAGAFNILGQIAAKGMPGNMPAPQPPPEPEPEQPQPKIELQPQPSPVAQTPVKVAPTPYKARKKRLEAPNRPPSRQNKRAATVWLDPAAKKQLDYQCVTEDLNCEEALREALNDWFDKRKLSRIA